MGVPSEDGSGLKSVGMQCHRGLQPRKDLLSSATCWSAYESCWLGLQCKVRGRFPVRLNIARTPIENKYCEGKMKTTLKRELKEAEIEHTETLVFSAPECGTQVEGRGVSSLSAALLSTPFWAPHGLEGGEKDGRKVATGFGQWCYSLPHLAPFPSEEAMGMQFCELRASIP